MNYSKYSGGISSVQIQKILQNRQRKRKTNWGTVICGWDQLFIKPVSVRSFIINTKPSDHPGEHWVSMFISSDYSVVEFFDSLGNPPFFYSQIFFKKLVKQFPNGVIYCHKKIQSQQSSLCGLFCIYFLEKRNNNVSFKKIIDEFHEKLAENDKKILTFFKFIK
jgi:hypothetical protein